MHPRLALLLIEAGRRQAVRLAAFAAALLSERTAIAGKPEYPEEARHGAIASDFFAQHLLLEKIDAAGFDPALCARYAVNASAARNILRTQALFLEHCRRRGMHVKDAPGAPEGLAQSLLLAYPDHLAVRKDKGSLVCRLRDERRGDLVRESMARGAEVLVAADIRETRDRDRNLKTSLSLATEIRPGWLREYFPGSFTTETTLEWNGPARAVESRTRDSCLGVVLSEKTSPAAPSPAASALLAESILAKQLKIDSWDAAVEEWIGRIRWLGEQFPDQALPRFTEEDRRLAVHALCEGECRYDRVARKPVRGLLEELLSWEQRRFADAMAPEVIALPSGRKLRIVYEPGLPPRGRARIQDLYGMRDTPRVAGGKAVVLIEVLAPNNRPVQITDDLARFWEVHYPEIRKSLSRRYPRHEWR
jgi:ATP-dependent helicase HrpB